MARSVSSRNARGPDAPPNPGLETPFRGDFRHTHGISSNCPKARTGLGRRSWPQTRVDHLCSLSEGFWLLRSARCRQHFWEDVAGVGPKLSELVGDGPRLAKFDWPRAESDRAWPISAELGPDSAEVAARLAVSGAVSAKLAPEPTI